MIESQAVAVGPYLTLNCWVHGQVIESIFPIEISRTMTVYNLKKVIKDDQSEYFRGVDASDLTVYKVSLPYGEGDDLENLLGTLAINSLETPLRNSQKLSTIFIPLPSDEQLHLIVDGLLSFRAWFRGNDPSNFVRFKITTDACVSDLQSVIKTTYGLDGVVPNRLQIYKIPVDGEAELRECLTTLASGRHLQWGELVGKIFDDIPFFREPCVVIELSAESPNLTGPATSKKHELFEDPFEANKRIRCDFATQPLQTPSIIAVPFDFQEHYKSQKKPHIRCGRPKENQSPFPLVLAHRIFAAFVSECETYKPSDEDLGFVLKLSYWMSQSFGDQRDQRTQFRACMREYGINLTEAKIEDTEFTTDGDARVGALPYLISKAKDFGATKGDPYIQAAAYHLAATQTWLRRFPNDLRALPCIHVFYNGPVFGFAGSMLTEEFDVNVLGPILPLFYHRTDIDLQIRCAKVFGALKNTAIALREYYENTTPQSFADTRFPWITQYDTIATPTEVRRYKYLSPMHGGNLLYICEHIYDKKRILVKFARTYSKDAHLASAAKGGAPKLLGHRDILSCGWSVVVMELLEEPEWVTGLKIIDKTEQRMVRDKVKEHVLALHQQGFVHGDIRPQNALVKRPETGSGRTLSVHLVDFDWAGEINKAKYPFLVNMDLGYNFKRPSGVEGGGIITTKHDLAMVDLMYPYA